ncbi:hypothetical protein GCM10010433_53210 [Streptomyces pulveraceus]
MLRNWRGHRPRGSAAVAEAQQGWNRARLGLAVCRGRTDALSVKNTEQVGLGGADTVLGGADTGRGPTVGGTTLALAQHLLVSGSVHRRCDAPGPGEAKPRGSDSRKETAGSYRCLARVTARWAMPCASSWTTPR